MLMPSIFGENLFDDLRETSGEERIRCMVKMQRTL